MNESDMRVARRVFISYARGSIEHEHAVLQLYELLRANGVDAILDTVAAERPQDWTTWMTRELTRADVVLCIASEEYCRRADGETLPNEGRGAQFEAALVRDAFYADREKGRLKFLPVLLPRASEADIPKFLCPHSGTHYRISQFDLAGVEVLLRYLTDQPAYVPPPLGTVPKLPAAIHQISRAPECIVVDGMGRGDTDSLEGALLQARDGACIVVRPGTYKAGVVVEMRIDFRGEGDEDAIVFMSDSVPAIIWRARAGSICGITLHKTGASVDPAIRAESGALSLSHLTVHNDGGPGIEVTRAIVTIRDSTIAQCATSGIVVAGRDAGATIQSTIIRNNRHDGIAVVSCGNLKVLDCTIDSNGTGVAVHGTGSVLIEGNRLTGNQYYGIGAEDGAAPLVRLNKILSSSQSGVYVASSGGVYEENEIERNGQSGVEVTETSDPVVRRNVILYNTMGGIYVTRESRGTFEDNRIAESGYAGFGISEGASPKIHRNKIESNRGPGLHFWENGGGDVSDNLVEENHADGVLVTSGSSPVLRHNRISRNHGTGITVKDSGLGTYEENEISVGPGQEAGPAVVVHDGEPVFRRNRFNTTSHPILVRRGAGGTYE